MASNAEKRSALKLALKIVSDKRNEERYCFSVLVNRETRERFGYYDMRRVLEDMLREDGNGDAAEID